MCNTTCPTQLQVIVKKDVWVAMFMKSLRLVFFLLHDIFLRPHSTRPFNRNRDQNQFFFFIMKLSENRFRVFWRSGCEVNSSYCDLRDGRPNVHAVLVLFKIAFFCSAADDTRLQRSEFSHIKWISSSLFQYVSFISLTELRCRAAVEELWKRTKDLCTEKTVTVKDNP